MIEKMIQDELTRLGCSSKWNDVITVLLENTKGVQYEFAESEPGVEILSILRSLNDDDNADTKALLFARRLASLETFNHRAMKRTPAGPALWNPLEQTLEEFSKNAENLRSYTTDHPYPPRDLIRTWFRHNLNTS